MNDLLEQLESWGKPGGYALLSVAGMALLLGVVLFLVDVPLESMTALSAEESGEWVVNFRRLAVVALIAFALPTAMTGVRLLTQRRYPPADEVFPPMAREDLERALRERTEVQCVCARCRVMIPAAFSTGSCPVCASSVEYHEVSTDEDAELVIAALN